MTSLDVLYNGSCPICSAEIAAYRRAAEAQGLPLAFHDLSATDLADWGIGPDEAARRLHLRQGDRLLSGLDAFRALWGQIPRLRWLAWLTGLPVVRPLAAALYDHALAPLLYALHRRRQSRADRGRATG